MKVHGIEPGVRSLADLREYYRRLWAAMPDLVIRHEAQLSTWSMGAVRWRGTGSRRAAFDGQAGDWAPIQMTGEMILRFSGDGRIAEIWLNDGPVEALEP